MNIEKYRIKPGKKFSLNEFKPDDRSARGNSKEEDLARLDQMGTEINRLQDILHAESRRKVLLVIQGMDTSGKDGTVRHVFSKCDPLGIRVASFKAPSADELAHDYLWRVHSQVPSAGELVIFNRSHYEDVLIVRVHQWIDEKECKRRYQQIRDFERMLVETGTTIVKCFLHISLEAQKARLEERLSDPDKAWKFNPNDLKERALWDDYMVAYEKAIEETTTEEAPWHVIPADSKTNRNLLISEILLQTLQAMDLKYPPKPAEFDNIVIE